jgi:hypothetical protein
MGTIGDVVRVRVIPLPDRDPQPDPTLEREAVAEPGTPGPVAPVLASNPR